MVLRMVSLLVDEQARREIDLVRALYDRRAVESTPPNIPLVAPFEEGTSTADLVDMLTLLIAVSPPFVLEVNEPQRFFDGDHQLLQFIAATGSDQTQRLAGALYRDVFPHHAPDDPLNTPLQRSALTVGRFDTEDAATTAALELQGKSYFLVISEVGVFELLEREDEESVWSLARTLPLGKMISEV